MTCLVEEEYKSLEGLEQALEAEGYEIAYYSPNTQLVMILANDKKLVVKPDTYDFNLIISMQDVWIPDGPYIIYEGQELSELFGEIDYAIAKSTGGDNNI
jgi:hypothetical protein